MSIRPQVQSSLPSHTARLTRGSGKHKWCVLIDDRTSTCFGQQGAEDFTIHKDESRKRNYISRHAGNLTGGEKTPPFVGNMTQDDGYPEDNHGRENWNVQNGLNKAGFWSRWLLWSFPDIKEAKQFMANKFNITFIDENISESSPLGQSIKNVNMLMDDKKIKTKEMRMYQGVDYDEELPSYRLFHFVGDKFMIGIDLISNVCVVMNLRNMTTEVYMIKYFLFTENDDAMLLSFVSSNSHRLYTDRGMIDINYNDYINNFVYRPDTNDYKLYGDQNVYVIG
jgi:hypothetical protein